MELHIKNMVCDRCNMAVRQELDKSGIAYTSVDLGTVVLPTEPTNTALETFRKNIEAIGFELIEDKTGRMIAQIKSAVLEYIRHPDKKKRRLKFSTFLSEKLNKDYGTLSNLFSSVEGTSIEQHVIHQKIERVKELVVYDELSLSQIADQLGYSSVSHLSNQFKKVTGLTPSHFKLVKEKRKPLDKVK